MDKTICITEEQYQQLVTDSITLAALQNGGVDNWEWHWEVINNFIYEYLRENREDFLKYATHMGIDIENEQELQEFEDEICIDELAKMHILKEKGII